MEYKFKWRSEFNRRKDMRVLYEDVVDLLDDEHDLSGVYRLAIGESFTDSDGDTWERVA